MSFLMRPDAGRMKPQAFMPYRLNGQYIMEGLCGGMFYTLGGAGTQACLSQGVSAPFTFSHQGGKGERAWSWARAPAFCDLLGCAAAPHACACTAQPQVWAWCCCTWHKTAPGRRSSVACSGPCKWGRKGPFPQGRHSTNHGPWPSQTCNAWTLSGQQLILRCRFDRKGLVPWCPQSATPTLASS